MKALLNGTSPDGRQSSGRSGSGSGRYVAVAVALLVLIGLLYGGAWWLTRTGPARPTVTAVVTVLPSEHSTAIAAVPPAATPTLVHTRPTTWTVTEMTDPQTGRTYYMAPREVVEMVLDDYQEADRFFAEHVFDVAEDDYTRFFSEPELSIALRDFRDSKLRDEAHGRAPLLNPNLRVLDFSADGLTVRVGEDFHGETFPVYDTRSRQVVREETAPVGTGIATIVYDSIAGRWKGTQSDFRNLNTSEEQQ